MRRWWRWWWWWACERRLAWREDADNPLGCHPRRAALSLYAPLAVYRSHWVRRRRTAPEPPPEPLLPNGACRLQHTGTDEGHHQKTHLARRRIAAHRRRGSDHRRGRSTSHRLARTWWVPRCRMWRAEAARTQSAVRPPLRAARLAGPLYSALAGSIQGHLTLHLTRHLAALNCPRPPLRRCMPSTWTTGAGRRSSGSKGRRPGRAPTTR